MRIVGMLPTRVCRKYASYTCLDNSYILSAYSLKKLFLECVESLEMCIFLSAHASTASRLFLVCSCSDL